MPDNLRLNIPSMDRTHDEFSEILKRVRSADKTAFIPLFEAMVEHTREHFRFEEEMMRRYDFYGRLEHIDEHATLLGEMQYFYEKSKRMPMMGRAYINDYAYEKFSRHVINIDSQLAMFLRDRAQQEQ